MVPRRIKSVTVVVMLLRVIRGARDTHRFACAIKQAEEFTTAIKLEIGMQDLASFRNILPESIYS